jgi:predicted membrane-bound mannosyltransferase
VLTTLPPAAFACPALRPGRRDAALLAAAVGFAVLLRLLLLEHRSFWWDERFARDWMELPASPLLGEANRIETNPPLYFLALKLWAGLFGPRDGVLRLPSALASALAGVLEALRARFTVVREASVGDPTPPNIRLRVLCFAAPRARP